MRAVFLIAVASATTQLPARDVAPATTWQSAHAEHCRYTVADDAIPAAGERTFRTFTMSRSVI